MNDIYLDCFEYLGEKPCIYGNHCSNCAHYRPVEKRILILKMGALGDALRTGAILPGLRKKYPNAEITWLTDEESYPLLKLVPDIDNLWALNLSSVLSVTTETFDLLLNFDKAPEALSLSQSICALKKMGFTKTQGGRLTIFNSASSYALKLGVDDHLKFFQNKMTYQEIIYQMAQLPYDGEKYTISILSEDKERAQAVKTWGPNTFVVGLNTGSGSRFATKRWGESRWKELAGSLMDWEDVVVLLLGGKAEEPLNQRLAEAFPSRVIWPGVHSFSTFGALVDLCDLVVSADTLAMHIAIGLSKYVVALFGPTVSTEIDLYGKGRKIIGVEECSPCYLQNCKLARSCVEKITSQEVLEEIVALYKYHKSSAF